MHAFLHPPLPSHLMRIHKAHCCVAPFHAVYVAHGTFDWAALAKQTAEEGDAGAKRKRNLKVEHDKRRPHMPNTPKPKPAAAAKRSSDTLVKPSAVTDRKFKLPTSDDQTGNDEQSLWPCVVYMLPVGHAIQV